MFFRSVAAKNNCPIVCCISDLSRQWKGNFQSGCIRELQRIPVRMSQLVALHSNTCAEQQIDELLQLSVVMWMKQNQPNITTDHLLSALRVHTDNLFIMFVDYNCRKHLILITSQHDRTSVQVQYFNQQSTRSLVSTTSGWDSSLSTVTVIVAGRVRLIKKRVRMKVPSRWDRLCLRNVTIVTEWMFRETRMWWWACEQITPWADELCSTVSACCSLRKEPVKMTGQSYYSTHCVILLGSSHQPKGKRAKALWHIQYNSDHCLYTVKAAHTHIYIYICNLLLLMFHQPKKLSTTYSVTVLSLVLTDIVYTLCV